jgi:hypothetical protein
LDPQALVASAETDSEGRYSVEASEKATWIGAAKPGYRYFAQPIRPTGTTVFDIELVPR